MLYIIVEIQNQSQNKDSLEYDKLVRKFYIKTLEKGIIQLSLR